MRIYCIFVVIKFLGKMNKKQRVCAFIVNFRGEKESEYFTKINIQQLYSRLILLKHQAIISGADKVVFVVPKSSRKLLNNGELEFIFDKFEKKSSYSSLVSHAIIYGQFLRTSIRSLSVFNAELDWTMDNLFPLIVNNTDFSVLTFKPTDIRKWEHGFASRYGMVFMESNPDSYFHEENDNYFISLDGFYMLSTSLMKLKKLTPDEESISWLSEQAIHYRIGKVGLLSDIVV